LICRQCAVYILTTFREIPEREVGMRVVRIIAARVALAIGIVAGVTGACLTAPADQPFVIRVDSITGPTAVPAGVSTLQHVWGRVGPDGSYRFSGFSLTRSAVQLDVTVNGLHTPSGSCAAGIVELGGETLRIDPIIPSVFTIVVHQPDGATLQRVLHGT
jgi:hypothetical protein